MNRYLLCLSYSCSFSTPYILSVKRADRSALSSDVSVELSSRAVSRKVFSPLQSLTSVFGMGTGGPSAFITLTSVNFRSLEIEQYEFRKMFIHLINPRQSRSYVKASFESLTRSP